MSWQEILKIKKFDEGIFRQLEDFIDGQVMQYPSSKIVIFIKPDNEMNNDWEMTASPSSHTESGLQIAVKQGLLNRINPSDPMAVLNRVGNEFKNNGYSYSSATMDGKYKGISINQETDHPKLSEYGGAGRAIRQEG